MGIVKRERRSGSKLLVPHAPIEGVDQGPMSVISFLGIVSLFDLVPFLLPDPRVSPRRRAQLQSRLRLHSAPIQAPKLNSSSLYGDRHGGKDWRSRRRHE